MERERISTHPLMLYPVTQSIAKNLNFRELLLMRQICIPWKYQADLSLKDRTKVVVKGSTNLRRLIKSIVPVTSNGPFIATDFVLESVELGDAFRFFLNFGLHIKALTLNLCVWSSVFLNEIIFEQLPNLVSLSLMTNHNPSHGTETLLPMSLDHCCKRNPVLKLKALEIIGDFSHRTDVLYRILKCSPELECMKQFKYFGQQDGLFGIWFFEILLSCKFQNLKCLELDCCIIEQQCQELTQKRFPLQRLSITFDDVSIPTIKNLINSFENLKNVEIGIEDNIEEGAQLLIANYKVKSNFWIGIFPTNSNKFVFPGHQYVLRQ